MHCTIAAVSCEKVPVLAHVCGLCLFNQYQGYRVRKGCQLSIEATTMDRCVIDVCSLVAMQQGKVRKNAKRVQNPRCWSPYMGYKP